MRQFLHRVFIENLPLKLLALVLSLVLFVAVRGDKDAATGVYAVIEPKARSVMALAPST